MALSEAFVLAPATSTLTLRGSTAGARASREPLPLAGGFLTAAAAAAVGRTVCRAAAVKKKGVKARPARRGRLLGPGGARQGDPVEFVLAQGALPGQGGGQRFPPPDAHGAHGGCELGDDARDLRPRGQGAVHRGPLG